MNPYKERTHKEKSKNSLSLESEILRQYFSELKPQAKRESEWKAFEGLKADYSEADIADSLTIVIERGIGEGGTRCHSPMAFLSKAISSVLEEVGKARAKAHERVAREEGETRERERRLEIEAREAKAWAAKECAFLRAFPGDDQQREVLAELCRKLPFKSNTEAGRVFAITRWWDSLKDYERMEFS
jgi:hypothetical protein